MWLNTSKNRIFFDMHFPDWPDRQTAQEFCPKEIADTFEKSHVDSVILYAKCQFGNFYYDTKIGKKHTGLGQQDLFRELCTLLHERGIRVIAYYSVAWDERIAGEHPEWLVQGKDGSRGSGGEYRWSTLCVNSPYREMVKEHLREITAQLQPDGFWIDMTIIGQERCFCPHCSEKYERIYHADLNCHMERKSAEYNRFLQFRYDYIEEFYHEIYGLIRSIKPDCQIANNYWGYPYSSGSMGSRAIGSLREGDYVTGEAYTDWTGLSAPGFFSKWLRSAAEGRPFEALIGRFTGTWDYTVKPPVQMALEAYTIAANGGTVTLDDEPYADGSIDPELYREIGRIFETIDRRRPYLDGKFLKHAAVFHSQCTKDYLFNNNEEFISSITGAYRLCKELGCPTEFLFDENVTAQKLNEYFFVLMPSVAVADKEQFSLLTEYLQNGGLVVAAGETMAYTVTEEQLVPVNWLEELTGLIKLGLSDYTVTYYRTTNSAYSCGLPERPVTVRGRYVKYSGARREAVAAWAVNPICETTAQRFFHNNLPAPYEKTEYPALVSVTVGKGTLLLFAQDVFAQFARYHQLEIKSLMRNILTVHKRQPSVRFHCSSNVETSALWQDGNLLLHLINFNPSMTVCTGEMDTFEARYPRTFEFVEEIQERTDIFIDLDFPVSTAYALDLGRYLEVTEHGEVTTVKLDRLKQWETIVLKIESQPRAADR